MNLVNGRPQLAVAAATNYDDAPCGYLLTRTDGTVLRANRLLCDWLQRDHTTLTNGHVRLQDLLTPGSRLFHDTHYITVLQLQGFAHEVSLDLLVQGRPPQRLQVLVNAQLRSEVAEPDRCVSITIFNATETRRHERDLKTAKRSAEAAAEQLRLANAALDSQNALLRVTLYSIADAVVTTDAQGRVQSMNAAAEALTGIKQHQALGETTDRLGAIFLASSLRRRPSPVMDCLSDERVVAAESDSVFLRRDGAERLVEDTAAPIRDDARRVIGAVWVCRDVTERRDVARKLAHGVSHDHLTGLLNRREFEKQITAHATSGGRPSSQVLCHIDLDQFKVLNDTAGPEAGDALLQLVARTLRDSLRQSDILARLGPDQFGVLLPGCTLGNGLTIAEQLRNAIAQLELSWQDRRFYTSATIGIAVADEPGTDAASLLADAELSCSTAKEAGNNRVFHFAGDGLQRRRCEMHWMARIDQALAEDRFVLYCQPIVSIGNPHGQPTKGEILLRMQDETGALLSPVVFIPAAERYGRMQAIDRWVLRKALAWMAIVESVDCSINVSGQSLGDVGFLEYALAQLELSGVDGRRVTFEITETAAVSSVDLALAFMKALKEKGTRFALDDFGAGLASFGYLKTFPVDVVKIDGSFVRMLLDDHQSRVIVEAIQKIAEVAGLQTVAEWVEDAATLQELSVIGVNFAQGYETGRPMPLDQWARAR